VKDLPGGEMLRSSNRKFSQQASGKPATGNGERKGLVQKKKRKLVVRIRRKSGPQRFKTKKKSTRSNQGPIKLRFVKKKQLGAQRRGKRKAKLLLKGGGLCWKANQESVRGGRGRGGGEIHKRKKRTNKPRREEKE